MSDSSETAAGGSTVGDGANVPPEHDADSPIIDLGNLELAPESFVLGRRRTIDGTRALLAYCLIGILAGVLLMLLLMVWTHAITADEFEKMLSVLLAPLVGLVGAATGYYYGRANRS